MTNYFLTPREIEIARLLAKDLSGKEMADRLGVQYSTLKTHLTHIRQALGVESRVGIAVWITRYDLGYESNVRFPETGLED